MERSCPYCAAVRRLVLLFALGGTVVWMTTGQPPLGTSADGWRGLTSVALVFLVVVLMMRLRQMRRRWDR